MALMDHTHASDQNNSSVSNQTDLRKLFVHESGSNLEAAKPYVELMVPELDEGASLGMCMIGSNRRMIGFSKYPHRPRSYTSIKGNEAHFFTGTGGRRYKILEAATAASAALVS